MADENWIGFTPFTDGAGDPSQIKVTCLRWRTKDGELHQIPMAFFKDRVKDWEDMEYFRLNAACALLTLACKLGIEADGKVKETLKG